MLASSDHRTLKIENKHTKISYEVELFRQLLSNCLSAFSDLTDIPVVRIKFRYLDKEVEGP